MEMQKQQIELEMIRQQMKQEADRHNKALADQKKQYDAKLKDNNQLEVIRQKMKDIKPDINEANRIAKIMRKEIRFSDFYVSKIDDSLFSSDDTADEVQVKVENFENGAIHVWSIDKFQDKLLMMKDALNYFEAN